MIMGILVSGKKCIVMQGKNFGKKIIIDKVDNNFVYFKLDNKEKKLSLLHVFPIEEQN
jgi:ribosomal protein L14E/L6E/L27E